MLRNGLEPWHIIVLLFGWKKMPDMARSFGRSARILRSEVDEMKGDTKAEAPAANVTHDTPPANAAPDSPAPVATGAGASESTPVKAPTEHTTTA